MDGSLYSFTEDALECGSRRRRSKTIEPFMLEQLFCEQLRDPRPLEVQMVVYGEYTNVLAKLGTDSLQLLGLRKM